MLFTVHMCPARASRPAAAHMRAEATEYKGGGGLTPLNCSPQRTEEDGKLDTGTRHGFLGFPALHLMLKINSSLCASVSSSINTGPENGVTGEPVKGCLDPSRCESEWAPWPLLSEAGQSGILYAAGLDPMARSQII